jgi:MFS family permease
LSRPIAAAGALLVAAFGLTFALDPWQDELVSDIPLYRGYADLFLEGVLPYSEIGFEYPPLAAPLFALPGLVSLELGTYRVLFAALTLVLAAGVMLGTGRLADLGGGGERRALLAVAAAPLAAGAMVRTHFDLAPVLCLVAGVAGIAGGRSRTGFALLGVGGALKVFPLAAAPVAAAWLAGTGRGREAAQGLAVAGGVAGLAIAAALALSPAGAWDAVEYHLERPVQLERLPATVLNGLDAAGARSPEPVHSHRSDGLEHPAADALSAAFAALLLAALAALALAAHRLADARGLVLAALASAAVLASLGKVLSPQFMLWLVPLAAVAWAWRMHALAAVTAAAVAATLAWFPDRYFDLVDRDTLPLAAVAARNLLLVVMLGLLAREIRRLLRLRESPGAARSSRPARPGAPRPAPR